MKENATAWNGKERIVIAEKVSSLKFCFLSFYCSIYLTLKLIHTQIFSGFDRRRSRSPRDRRETSSSKFSSTFNTLKEISLNFFNFNFQDSKDVVPVLAVGAEGNVREGAAVMWMSMTDVIRTAGIGAEGSATDPKRTEKGNVLVHATEAEKETGRNVKRTKRIEKEGVNIEAAIRIVIAKRENQNLWTLRLRRSPSMVSLAFFMP